MTVQTSQIPLHHPIADNSLFVNQQWAFWFQQFVQSLPPSGSGYVIDGTASSYGPMTLYQGPDANRGSNPGLGDIYFALDTGKIYVEQAGQWVLQIPAFSGDVSSTVNNTSLTLATVNLAPGVYGSSTEIPVITVDGKGRVTSVFTASPSAVVPPAAGPNFSVQFNYEGITSGSGSFTFNPINNTLTVPNFSVANQFVGGEISFFNPVPTFNNLSPLTTKGDLLGHDSVNNVRIPVGADGRVLTADSAAASGVSWQIPSGGGDGTTPYYIPVGDSFTNALYRQNLFNVPITVDGTIVVDGLLIEV